MVTVRPRSLNPREAVELAICPIICSFYYLPRALMHDVACEFACAVGYAETISADVLNSYRFKLMRYQGPLDWTTSQIVQFQLN